jgi:hypothetical protein
MCRNNGLGGIYEIRNTIDGKRYVGSSTNIERRWRHHAYQLRGGCHYNRYLQNAWNKHGELAFEFKVLVYTEPEENIRLENLLLSADSCEYNIAKDAKRPQLGRPRSERVKQKLSKINSGENHPQYGTLHSDETRRKLSVANTGNRHTEETKRKISKATAGENNPMYGTSWTDKQRECNEARRIDLPVEEIEALRCKGYYWKEIARIYGVSKWTVWKRMTEAGYYGRAAE